MMVENVKQANLQGYNGYGSVYKKCQIEGCELDNPQLYSLPLCDVHWIKHMHGEIVGNWKND